MGIHDRDWYRESWKEKQRRRQVPGVLVLFVVLAGAALVLHFTRAQATFDSEKRQLHGDTRISLLPGLPSITLHGDSLYWPHDQWTAYLADEKTCPGGERTDLPLAQQAETMVCLIDYARRQRGLGELSPTAILNGSSIAKAERIVRCRQFAHDACNEDPAADARGAGYVAAFGENLYIAEGRYGAPRVALDGWLNSPGHRDNLFRPEWRSEGIAVQRLDHFGSYRDATLWINEFGTQ
jgi:uncharacterized protein YkwD